MTNKKVKLHIYHIEYDITIKDVWDFIYDIDIGSELYVSCVNNMLKSLGIEVDLNKVIATRKQGNKSTDIEYNGAIQNIVDQVKKVNFNNVRVAYENQYRKVRPLSLPLTLTVEVSDMLARDENHISFKIWEQTGRKPVQFTACGLEVKKYLDQELADDKSGEGGVSHIGEKLDEFIDEVYGGCGDMLLTMKEVNKALKECGIEPIKVKKHEKNIER